MRNSADSLRAACLGVAVLALWLGSACGPQYVPPPTAARPYNGGHAAGATAAAGQGGGFASATGGVAAAGRGGNGIAGSGAAASGPPTPVAGSGAGGNEVPFDAGSDPDRNKVKPGGVCARLAAISCAGEAHCCSAPTRTNAACRSAVMTSCTNDAYLDQSSQNTVTGFDTSAAEESFAQLEQKASQCDPSIAGWSLGNDGLRTMFKGTLAAGANCKPASAGVTDKAKDAAALLSCTSFTTSACLPKSLLGSWNCSPKNGVDGSCVTDYNCMDSLFCSNPSMAPLGKCAARLAVGGSCTDPTQCTTFACKGGRCVVADQDAAYCGE